MRKQLLGAFAVGAVAALTLTACGGTSSAGGGASSSSKPAGKVGVILPDTASSARWENSDRPAFEKAFKDAGVDADIQNAQGDDDRWATIAEGMIASKVSVLVVTSLNDKANAIIKKATSVGIPVIDYDRANLGAGAQYYVSFDNVKVGETIGNGLLSCLKADGKTSGGIVELNGSPTDNNATLFKQGYDKVIKAAGYSVVADQSVPKWDNTQAGTLFENIYTKQKGKFVGVAAANDGLGGAVISVLSRNGLAGKVPVSGQDATVEGLQRILLGTQCNSVFKPASLEVTAASKLAIDLAKGDTAAADALASQTFDDPVAKSSKKAILSTPIGVTKDNVKDVIEQGAATAADVCTTAALKKACTAADIS